MNRQPMLRGNGFVVSRNLDPNLVRVESLKPLGRETRKHPPSQIRKLQESNRRLKLEIEAAWEREGVLTFNKLLRDQLNQMS